MGRPEVRSALKSLLPSPVLLGFRTMRQIVRRVVALAKIAMEIRGRGDDDRKVVRAGLLNFLRTIGADTGSYRSPVLMSDAEVVVANMGIFYVRGKSDDLIHVIRSHNADLLRLIEEILQPCDTAVDAGANVGGLTVAMARRVGPEGAVIAFEMMPSTAKCLRRNLELNDIAHVRVVEQALSDIDGDLVTAAMPSGSFGQASIAPLVDTGLLTHETVHTTTLARSVGDLSRIKLMKMDLEGHELAALRGAGDDLSRFANIIFESWDNDGGEVASYLKERGFAVRPVDGRNFHACQLRRP